MNDEQIVKKAMSILGSRTSPLKARKAKENGKLGGRPRKSNSKDHANGSDNDIRPENKVEDNS